MNSISKNNSPSGNATSVANMDTLITEALEAMTYSYSPYSEKRIGAAVRLTNGKTYSGCNIENASYGGTVCAERTAIFKAYSENLSSEKITHVVVASDEISPWPPCGFCRQVIAEFCNEDTLVILTNKIKKQVTYKFSDLFPSGFKPEHLNKDK